MMNNKNSALCKSCRLELDKKNFSYFGIYNVCKRCEKEKGK